MNTCLYSLWNRYNVQRCSRDLLGLYYIFIFILTAFNSQLAWADGAAGGKEERFIAEWLNIVNLRLPTQAQGQLWWLIYDFAEGINA